MQLNITQAPRDFWGGLIYLLVGAAAVFIAADYERGSLLRMGPGYVPAVLGYALCGVGLISVVRSFLRHGDRIMPFAVKAMVLVTVAVVAFGVLARGAGLVPAVVVLVVVSAWGSRMSRPLPVLLLALGSAVASWLLFTKGLGVPLQAFGAWFGF